MAPAASRAIFCECTGVVSAYGDIHKDAVRLVGDDRPIDRFEPPAVQVALGRKSTASTFAHVHHEVAGFGTAPTPGSAASVQAAALAAFGS